MTELELFEAALEQSPADRAACLDEACAGNKPLRQRLEALLARHEKAASFLEAPAAELHATVDPPSRERPGIIIASRYKLLEQIGEGGMGTVWVAEQTEPVKRRVALKLIKPGMDSRQVLSRFEAERQALALMDHPNIAKVYDGGMTEEGRPFFVMEYVKGMPITEYCDHVRLSIADRLKLFVPVCQAVQHAHHKGIIHRDLKPSNILICLYDGQPVPKVIDFGLAKAMHQPLTENTLYTAHGLMVGTPLYMSPEQAEFNNLDVDTRTDIYSLGVILYELLTGATPLERKQIKDAAFQELLRLIKEVEPERPSLKISTSMSLPVLAAQRNLEPAQLSRAVRGDLDWIVMKAVEKERSRRYATANGLALDIERYLSSEPIQARPPSTAYRLRKYAQRNKSVALATLFIAASLLLGTAISTWQAIRATAAERHAERNLANALEGMRQMLGRLPDSRLESNPQATAARLAILEDALIIYEALAREPDGRPSKSLAFYRRDLATARSVVSWRLMREGDRVAAAAMFKQEVAASESALTKFPEVPELRNRAATAQSQWAGSLYREGDYDNAERGWRRAIQLSPPGMGREIRQLRLASLLQTRNRPKEALEICERVLKVTRDGSLGNSVFPSGDPSSFVAGIAHYVLNDWDSAIDAFQSSMKLRRGGDSHEYFYLAMTYWQKGRMDDSRRWYDKAVDRMKKMPAEAYLFGIQYDAEQLLQPTSE